MWLSKKIIPLICIIAISFKCLVIPASASSIGEAGDFISGVVDFGQWAIDSSIYGIKLVARIFDEDVCPERPGGVNATHSFVVNKTTKDGVFADWYVCEYCGFNSGYKADSEGLASAYNDYVQTLPVTGYNSAGKLIFHPSRCSLFVRTSSTSMTQVYPNSNLSSYYSIGNDCFIYARTYASPQDGDFSFGYSVIALLTFAGYYKVLPGLAYSYSVGSVSGAEYYSEGSFEYRSLSASGTAAFRIDLPLVDLTPGIRTSEQIEIYFPTFEVVPDVAVSDNTYDITTRPTSIEGGNYGIVGDNGQITRVDNNSTIVNETNNTYYNPATGQTQPITNWSYDYSDRSYNIITESGDEITVTYGDENISITETMVNNSGDTITNNYTIYYIVEGGGSETPPSSCTHDWQETGVTPATCTVPGSRLLTCSLCQQTQSEAIPALGHDWQVKQVVTTQYDDTGQLIQQGYTIYQCSRCGAQYKSTDGTAPPGSGSGSGPEDGESIWDKIGGLLGTVVNGILDLLGSLVDTVLGGLVDLITNLFETLKQLVDLFGSVGEAFGVLWTWLPPEITAVLVTGVSIFVFVALLKFFMN